MIAPITPSDSEIAEVRIDPVTRHRALFTRKDFKQDEVISAFSARKTFDHPTYLTVQTGEQKHIELFPDYLECINHSCEPNCFFDTTAGKLIALRPISSGEELKFFYPSSEWDMDQAFQCNCKQPNCLGLIKGAKYLPENTVRHYRFTDFIRAKLGAQQRSALPSSAQRAF